MTSHLQTTGRQQQGSALFIMIMILVALTILTFMATNIGKTDARIGNAYTEQTRAFIKAEEMLARLRYAIEQLPLPEGVATGTADKNNPIWQTKNLVNQNTVTKSGGEPDFRNPLFGSDPTKPNQGWESDAMSCTDIQDWMKNTVALQKAQSNISDDPSNPIYKFEPLDCNDLDPNNRAKVVLELINRRQSEGDIDDLHDTYYYRITIRAQGANNGEALVQGITGIQYN